MLSASRTSPRAIQRLTFRSTLVGLLLAAATATGAQDPELYANAQAQLSAADTAAALASLRQLTEEERNFAPGWGLLGRILAAQAGGVATDFRERREADEALRRAIKLDPGHPLYLLGLAELMRKQQIYLDARRVLGQAMEAAEKDPDRLPAAELATLWFQRGLFYEDVYLDTRHLMFVPDIAAQTPDCAALGTFCLNFTNPKRFNETFRHAGDLSEEGEDDFENMADAFRRALEADPSHAGAFRRLAIHLIDRADYPEAVRLSRTYIAAAPDGPWGHLTLALASQRTGQDSLAEVEFDLGLERAPTNLVAHYQDISPLLRESQARGYLDEAQDQQRLVEEILWRKSDPLYLTPGNEVRVAHLARVAYADLMFEDPSEGVWGAETEQGIIYVRYGPPQHIWQIQRDVSREMSGAAFETSSAGPQGGGRWIFWNYGWGLPNFIFAKQSRWRHASHMLSSYSKSAEEAVREAVPASYTTSFEMYGYPVQLARFRGAADSIIELDLYSEVPAEKLLTGPGSLDLGLYVYAGVEHVRVYERTMNIDATRQPQALTYSLPLLGGRYTYSLEARASNGSAAVRREAVEVAPFLSGTLALSDLVLAQTVTPRVSDPTDRRGFAIKVSRKLQFEPYEPFAFYWEVYGLEADAEGFANYQVTISVTDAAGGGVLAKVAGAIGGLLGLADDEEIELTYERLVELTGDRVPEYMSLEVATDEPGDYRLQVEVSDRLSGRTVTGERIFKVVGPE